MQTRFILELDQDRMKAGWGSHYWIIDTTLTGWSRYLALLPTRDAEREVARMNSELRSDCPQPPNQPASLANSVHLLTLKGVGTG
jgi:hypothetical protein